MKMARQTAGMSEDLAGREGRADRPASLAPGFSLLEVLVATTLMGLVLVALLQVLSASFSAQEASIRSSQAVLVADKVLQDYCGSRNLAAGDFQGQEGSFSYRVRRSLLFDFSSRQSPSKVACTLTQVTVFWEERGRAKSLELETIRSVYQ